MFPCTKLAIISKMHLAVTLVLNLTAVVIGSAKRSLIADFNRTYLKTNNSTCKLDATLKLGPNNTPNLLVLYMKVIA